MPPTSSAPLSASLLRRQELIEPRAKWQSFIPWLFLAGRLMDRSQ
jgi:hypothetical protein